MFLLRRFQWTSVTTKALKGGQNSSCLKIKWFVTLRAKTNGERDSTADIYPLYVQYISYLVTS
jgi:hypothetical protein